MISVAAFALASCSGHDRASVTAPTGAGASAAPLPSTLSFRASPIALEQIRYITPLGNLNPPAHTTPTDHIYFYFAAPNAGETPAARRTDFFAPADGVVMAVLSGPDTKVFVRAASGIRYYLDHLTLDAPLAVGATMSAGQRIGTTGGAYGVDLGVVNDTITLAFANPSRYNDDTLHADAPLKYFTEPLRAQLYAKVQRIGGDLDGRIDYDVNGTLSGNWYGAGGAAMSFAYDTYDPSQVRISVGALQGGPGVYGIGPGEPLPRDVSPASGVVRYTLMLGPSAVAQMLVQMLDAQRIQIEVFASSYSSGGFSSNAIVLTR
jgi:hypothetical protein